MATKGFLKELARAAGRENVLYSPRDLLAYSYDATQHQELPEAIIFPRNTSIVSKIMKLAYREKVPVIPRGAGTGISGGTVPVKGGIILELSRMNAILALDTVNRRAIVEPGVVNLDLQEALAPLGFMYPPDPASQKSCTLGGNIGENAGGPLCFRYGVTSRYVCGLEVVLPDGEIMNFGADVEDTPGYDLRGLLIGSEGILGIATRLVLNIVPLPESSRTMLAVFDSLEDTGQAVSDIISAGIVPNALELMDKKMCWAIEQSLHAGYPVDAEGVLLIEIAGLTNSLDRQVNAISKNCEQNKVRELRLAGTGAERDGLWKGRKGAFGSVARICPHYLVNDGTVPRNKLVPALLKIQEIASNNHVQIANVAHAGDGNLHPLILFDRSNPEEVRSAKITGEEILDTCLALGGTISGEHGIGLEKLSAMYRAFSPVDLTIMRKIKQVFDPADILNPGKLLPPEKDASATVRKPDIQETRHTTSSPFYQRLMDIAGMENLQTGSQVKSLYQTDGFLPDAVVLPSNTQQVAQIIQAANQHQKAVIPRGHGSKNGTGPCLSACNVVLCLKNLDSVIDLDRGNFTVRVGAGKSINELQRQLAEYRLFFPLDPLFLRTATIGGELAVGGSGPKRLMYGSARDLVLGLTVVTPTGDIIHPGGKTMKNVAGLDLCKLFVGSRGTLGVITEATLRVFSLPEVSNICALTLPGKEQAYRVVNAILNSKLTPCSLELIDRASSRLLELNFLSPLKRDEVLLMVGVEGNIEVVERHLKEIHSLAQAQGASARITIEDVQLDEVRKSYYRLHQSFIHKYPFAFTAKASVPLSKSAGMFDAVKEIGQRHGFEIGIQGRCGNGILYLYVPAEKEKAVDIILQLKEAALNLGGFLVLENAPPATRKTFGIWDRPTGFGVMEKVKKALDPENILNPGKLVGG